MIVVAGLTPAWQKTLRFSSLQWGEVNRAGEAVWCASGKVLNVGIAGARLGGVCRTICPVGGPAGEEFRREFDALGIDVEWIPVAEPTRVCTTLLDGATGMVTELVENASPMTPAELDAYRNAYARAAVDSTIAVFTGSLPAAVPKSFYRELAEATPGRIVVDARGAELAALLDGTRNTFLAKPNREELAMTVGRTLSSDADLYTAMRELNDRGAEWIVVTDGPRAVWVSSAGAMWKAVPPTVAEVVNPIGCGDCLAAGIAVGLDAGRDTVDAVKLGMAAAADNLGMLLPARIQTANVARWAESIDFVRVD